MILGVPCYENHDLTAQLVASLVETVGGPLFTLVIVDNASITPYDDRDYATWGRTPFPVVVLRNAVNEGNFYPLAQVRDFSTHSIVALAHNDLIFYEPGWDLRVEQAFADDPQLGMVGFAGSWEINGYGAREHGTTMSNLRGERGHVTAEGAGVRITDLRPSVAVDGLFMAFRREALASLTLNHALPPAHFYDYIWGAEVIEAGWRQATMGVDMDHVGWSTEVKLAAELDGEWRRWCTENRLAVGAKPMDAIWALGHEQWMQRFHGRFFPCKIGADWVRS
jgi:hypothetical protein